jgi:hypothetical protein
MNGNRLESLISQSRRRATFCDNFFKYCWGSWWKEVNTGWMFCSDEESKEYKYEISRKKILGEWRNGTTSKMRAQLKGTA